MDVLDREQEERRWEDSTTMHFHRTDGMVSTSVRRGDMTRELRTWAESFGPTSHVHRITVTRDLGHLSLTVYDTRDVDGRPSQAYTHARREVEAFFFANVDDFSDADLRDLGAALRVAARVEEGPFSVFRQSEGARKRASLALLARILRMPEQTQISVAVLCAGMREAY